MQKNICAICLQPVNLDTDILQNDDIKCVHYTCLNQSQFGGRILAQASYQDQSDEHETLCNKSFRGLTKKPAFSKLPLKQSFTLSCTPTRIKTILFPVQEYSVNHEVYSKTSKRLFKTYSSSGSAKWFSSMRKHSHRIMPLFIRNKCFLRKEQCELPLNEHGEEATIFPFIINDSDVYSSEILDWLAIQKKNQLPDSLLEKPIPKPAPSVHHKKKVTIQDSCDPYLTEHKRNRDYRKSLPRRTSRSRREISTMSIGSQYSNHSSRLKAADFMDWVTSAPKIPNGNMLILLDCRNKKDTKSIGVQPSYDDLERRTARKTAESLILDLIEGRKGYEHYEYYPNCQRRGSSVTLVKTCTTESRMTSSVQEIEKFHGVSVMEEPKYTYPETVEDRMHHVVSIVFNALGHLGDFVGRVTKVIKGEFPCGDKDENLDNKSDGQPND